MPHELSATFLPNQNHSKHGKLSFSFRGWTVFTFRAMNVRVVLQPHPSDFSQNSFKTECFISSWQNGKNVQQRGKYLLWLFIMQYPAFILYFLPWAMFWWYMCDAVADVTVRG